MKFTSFPIRTDVKKIWKGLTAPQITSPSRMPGNLELRMLCQRVRLPIRSMACDDEQHIRATSISSRTKETYSLKWTSMNLYDVECRFVSISYVFLGELTSAMRKKKKKRYGPVLITRDLGVSSSCNHLLMFFSTRVPQIRSIWSQKLSTVPNCWKNQHPPGSWISTQ